MLRVDFIVEISRLRACLSYRGDWTGQQELLNWEYNCHPAQQNIGDSPQWCRARPIHKIHFQSQYYNLQSFKLSDDRQFVLLEHDSMQVT